MSELVLQLFGVPRIQYDGADIKFSRRKSMAMLAFLAVNKRCTRQSLATLFWPEANANRAMANLRNAIYAMGDTPVKHWLRADRSTISLNFQDTFQVDVQEFYQLSGAVCTRCGGSNRLCEKCVTHLNRLVELYGDGFLVGFTISGSPEFEQWQYHENQFFLRESLKALKQLANHYEATLQWELAIACTRRLIELEPLDETGWRAYIRTLVLAGRKNEAINQYRRLQRLLLQELDLPPDSETSLLVDQIESGKISPVFQEESSDLSILPLPVTQTPFVGRSKEISQIVDLLLDSAHRLVTLSGPGGCGKSRLALQVATTINRRYRDGVAWVSFTAEESPESIYMKLADVLRLNATAIRSIPEAGKFPEIYGLKTQLMLHLQKREMLLVLDNFEHLADSCGYLAEMIQMIPGIQFLVTSRLRTRLKGEWVYDIGGLMIPISNDPKVVAESDAVRLFCQSARQASQSFRLAPQNRETIANICRTLHGIPLALEMAAAWLRVLDPADVANEIQKNLDFLRASTQDLPEKHRSLRAIFQQTWDGLTPRLQHLFMKLSVFSGGFTLDAAREVTDATYTDLASFVDKSILMRQSANRYAIHELLRQYASELLNQDKNLCAKVISSHRHYYMLLLSQTGESLTHGDQKNAFRLMNQESANTRSAWIRAASVGDIRQLRGAATAMFLFFDQKYFFQQGYEVFQAASHALAELRKQSLVLSNDPAEAESSHNTQALAVFEGYSAGLQGWFLRYSLQESTVDSLTQDKKITEARHLMETALKLLRPYADQPEWALINVLYVFFINDWKNDEVLVTLDRCIDVFESHSDFWGKALTTVCKGCWYFSSDLKKALAFQKEALEIRRQAGDLWGVSQSFVSVGAVLLKMKDFDAAESMFLQGLELVETLGENPNGHVEVLMYLGFLNYQTEKIMVALDYYKQGLEISKTMNNVYRTARILGNIGVIHSQTENYAEAVDALNQCLAMAQDAGCTSLHDHYLAALESIPVEKRIGTVLGR